MGWGDKRVSRMEKEAKALKRKAQRYDGYLAGKDAARLRQVQGRIVKESFYDHDDDWGDNDER